jgi:hypothetical protein
MNKISTCLMALAMLVYSGSSAQRYLTEVFTEVDVQSNITYGVNATVIAYSQLGQAIPQPLVMDVYSPAGDTETNRPLVLYFHTGNFLPTPQNGSPSGTKTDLNVVEMCTRLARMGYVVASCDYRLGWNPVASTQEERVYTLINAAYRGVQDCRTAIRYFRKTEAENANPYGIDPSRICVWGQGTGGYIAFAAATINEYADIAIPKFTREIEVPPMSGNFITVPMVIEEINGDIYGTSVGINPNDGDTLCYPNHMGYSSDFSVMVNMGGACGDSSWVTQEDVPMISFHAPSDPFAPYGIGTVIVPGFNLPVVEVSGSYHVQQMAGMFGLNMPFALADGEGDIYTTQANTYNNGLYGLYPLNRPSGSETDSAPWEWWNADNPNNANGLLTNPDMSMAKGMAYLDTIQGYSAPRIMCAMQLPGSPCELIAGCTSSDACNFNPDAEVDDASCVFPGEPCDDGDPNTVGEFYNTACECVAPVEGCTVMMACNYNADANTDDGSCYFPGDLCDDGDPNTTGEVWDMNCECSSTAVAGCMDMTACNYDMNATVDNGSCAFPADPCDDGDPNTTGEIYDANCECSAAAVAGCMAPTACNYNVDATVEDGSCYFVGDACDDGDANTSNDVYNANCECEGVVSVDEIEAAFLIYPNPSEGLFTINNLDGTSIQLIEIFDITGKRVMSLNPFTSNVVVDMTAMSKGMYTVRAQGANAIQTIRVQRM